MDLTDIAENEAKAAEAELKELHKKFNDFFEKHSPSRELSLAKTHIENGYM